MDVKYTIGRLNRINAAENERRTFSSYSSSSDNLSAETYGIVECRPDGTNEAFNVTLIAIDRRIDDVLKLDLTQSFVFGLF